MLLTDVETGRALGLARSMVWDRVRDRMPPAPIRRGPKWVRWPSTQIETVERAIISGASDNELRALERELTLARAAGRNAA